MTPQINHPKINTTKNLTAAPFEKRNTRQHNGEKMNDPMTPNDQLHNLIFPSLKKFSHMKNFFEFFGFLSMAGISAALIFLFIGKKEGLKGGGARGGFLTEMSATAEVPDAPRAIADRPARSEKREKSARSVAAPSAREIAPEEQLKSLYNDDAFVAATAKKWKSAVADAADEYNIKPQVLLAHVLVQSYLGGYSKSDFNDDVARHAGERVKPVSAALKGYRYGWSMQKRFAALFPRRDADGGGCCGAGALRAGEKNDGQRRQRARQARRAGSQKQPSRGGLQSDGGQGVRLFVVVGLAAIG
jgi:hypothetical protein